MNEVQLSLRLSFINNKKKTNLIGNHSVLLDMSFLLNIYIYELNVFFFSVCVLISGKPFNNYTIINAAIANIIVSILLSRRFEYEDPTIQKLMSLVNENIKLLGSPRVRVSRFNVWLLHFRAVHGKELIYFVVWCINYFFKIYFID